MGNPVLALDQKLNMIRLYVLLATCLFMVNGHKVQNFKKKDLKNFDKELKQLKAAIAKMQAETALIEECVQTSPDDPNWANVCVAPEGETSDRSDKDTADDVIWAASMYRNSGERCSPHQLDNCATTLDDFYDSGGTTLVTNTYTNPSSCSMTAPKNGYYNVCVYARFKKGGNAGDVTIALGGTTYAAAFGDAVGDDWRSTGTCTIRFLNIGSPIYAQFHSGGGDCI